MLMSVLHVAQKNSIAKQVANILSKNTKRNIPTLSKYNPIFQFNMQGKLIKFTSVRGHIFDYQLPSQCKNWHTYDNRKILSSQAPMVKKLGKDMQDLVHNLNSLAQQCKQLILWLDCDRQGQAIAFQVIQICKKKNPYIKIQRARFAAVTPQDVWKAYRNLVKPNQLQADAVNYRIQIDFRLGCTFTRYQTICFNQIFKLSQHLVVSYGPCQMPTLSFVVNRHLQIKNFKPQKYWFIDAICVINQNTGIPFNWSKKNTRDQKLANQTIIKIINKFQDGQITGEVKQRKNNPKKKYRPYPLITVQFQKLATSKLKLSSAKAMEIAERLYQKGFISYPRTETNAFPKTMNLRNVLQKIKGSNSNYDQYIKKLLQDEKFMIPKTGNKNDQAHTPIHPVKAVEKQSLSPDEWKVYDLIYRHFLACCSKDAVGQEYQIKADIGGEQFKASYLTVLQKNYLEIYPFQRWVQTSFPAQIPRKFPVMLTLKDSKTTPPGYLSESDLIDLMQKNQIGTDSTIHQHIQTIQKRHYAIKSNNTFKPTDLGSALVQTYSKFQIQLPKCQIRRSIQQNMVKISSGELSKSIAVTQTLNQMIPIYQKLVQIKQAWLRVMKQIIQNTNDIPKVCNNSLNNENQSNIRQNRQHNDNSYTNTNNSFGSTIKCFKCGQIGHIAPDCPNNNPNNNNNTNNNPNKNKNTNNHLNHRYKSSQQTNLNSIKSIIKCYKCGQTGHIAPDCPNNNTNNNHLNHRYKSSQQINSNRSNSNSKINCYKCGEQGHFAKNCTGKTTNKNSNNIPKQKNKYNNQISKNQFKCFTCGESGHFAPDCPKKNGSSNIQKNTKTDKEKKICPQCGHEGRHPKNSTCNLVKKRNKNSGSHDFL